MNATTLTALTTSLVATAPQNLTAASKVQIYEDILTPPSEVGYAFSIWTVVRLCVHTAVQYRARICTLTMRSISKGLGFRHTRL